MVNPMTIAVVALSAIRGERPIRVERTDDKSRRADEKLAASKEERKEVKEVL